MGVLFSTLVRCLTAERFRGVCTTERLPFPLQRAYDIILKEINFLNKVV